jgi:hypothetical protein
MADREVTYVDTSNPLWAAMVFLATLAYPENYGRRDRAILAMKALMYRASRRFGMPLASDSSAVLAQMPPQQQNGTLRRLTARLNKRRYAGSVAAELLTGVRRPGRTERISPVDQQRTQFSLMKRGKSYPEARRMVMSRRVLPGQPWSLNDFAKRFPSGPARFKSDAWRPEVLHLILAFNTVAITWRDPHGFNIARLLANPEWVLRALEHAESNATLLPRTINLPKSLARVRTTRFIRLIPQPAGPIEISEPPGSI